MYSIRIIGAMVIGQDGEFFGIVDEVQHDDTGTSIILEALDVPEPGAKEPAPETLGKLRMVEKVS